MTKIAHLTDLHFGRIIDPEIVEVAVREVNALGAELVVVSGDLTQRARPRQYEAAVAMLAAFDAPLMVVPGNHDVYPWWRPVGRLFRPLHRYRHYIAGGLMPVFDSERVAVLGINSAFGWTVKGGCIGAAARAQIGSFFAGKAADVFKILVVHHHLRPIEGVGRGGGIWGGAATWRRRRRPAST